MSEAAQLAEKPPHVPDHLCVDFDFIGETRGGARWQSGAAQVFQQKGPIFWTPHAGGHWLVGGYDVLFDMAQDPETFSSDYTKYPPDRMIPRNIPLSTDPPEHTGYRAPLVKALTPRVVNEMKSGIRELARSMVAGFANKGRCDALSDYAEMLPLSIVLKLVGLPTDRIREWRCMMPGILNARTSEEREVIKNQIRNIVQPYITERRRERKDDLISILLDSTIDGRPFTDEEMIGYASILFTGGFDTVTGSMSFAIYHMASDQELQQKLRNDPTLIPLAVEEFLRRYSVVTFRRYVMKDVVFHGVQMKRFDRIVYNTAAANLDPSVFPDPLAIDLDRDAAPHLTFLTGPHRCPASHLARAEMAIAYEELLSGLPPFRLDPEVEVEPVTGLTFGLKEVPLIWDPIGQQ